VICISPARPSSNYPTANKGLELTPYSVRSSLAPASSRSSGLALGGLMKEPDEAQKNEK